MKKRHRNIGSFPYINIFVIFFVFQVLVNFLCVLFLNSNNLTQLLEENIVVQLYLKSNISIEEKEKLRSYLEQQPFIATENNNKKISFIDKSEGAKIFQEETGEDFIKITGENFLPDAFHIYVKKEYFNEDALAQIKKTLSLRKEIDDIHYPINLINTVLTNLKKIGVIIVVICSVILFLVFIIFNSSIRLALHSQKGLVKSMQLIGATNSYIMSPYIKRSLLISLFTNLIAAGSIIALYFFFIEKSYQMQFFVNSLLYTAFAISTFIGLSLSFISSFFAVRTVLKSGVSD